MKPLCSIRKYSDLKNSANDGKNVPQFFVTSSQIENNRCSIHGGDFRHLAAVRRVKPGDTIRLRDEKGTVYTALIDRIAGDHIDLEITEAHGGDQTTVDITLCMCLLKGGNFDLVVEKSVEIGVSRIIPVVSERTVPRPADGSAKLRRWVRKAEEAAKQSLRDRVPSIEQISSFGDVISMNRSGVRIIAHPGAPVSLKEFLHDNSAGAVALLVGPEGGFSPAEIISAAAAGWVAVDFGFSQLRAETAAAVLCGIIVYEWGDASLGGEGVLRQTGCGVSRAKEE
jgi:16S rRNA (uracil1498-N3)-methyltransferase